MTTWLIFGDRQAADDAVARIDANMGFPGTDPADVTSSWAVPRETADGKWAIEMPPKPADLAGVEGYVETDAPAWPEESGMGDP
jgi:hypothetical protein